MPIRFHCQDCDAKIKVPEGAEGRKVKCPRCGSVHRVPIQAVSVPPPTPDGPIQDEDVDLDSLVSAIGGTSTDEPAALDEIDPEDPTDPETSLAHADEVEEESDQSDSDQLDLDEDETDEDPLSALASMADGDTEPEPGYGSDVLDDDELFGEQEQQQEPLDSLEESEPDPAPPSPDAVPVASATPTMIPLARPKPQPEANPSAQAIADEPLESPVGHQAEHRPATPQPRAIPLSNGSATVFRPKAKPIPLGHPTNPGPVPLSPPSTNLLLLVGWLLRVLAFLTLGGTVKLVLLASSLPFTECMLVLLYGVTFTVMAWALAELVLFVHNRHEPQL